MVEPGLAGILQRWGRRGGPSPEPGTVIVGPGVELLQRLDLQLESSPVVTADSSSTVRGERCGLAGAMVMAAAGMRCSVWTTEAELHADSGVVAMAAGRHFPLVIYAVADTATNAGDHGAVVLTPADLTAALDVAMAARLIAETALIPVVVVLDRRTLVEGVQSVWYPSAASTSALVGHAADEVHSPTAAQRQAFGDHRRRVPRRHDVGRPQRFDLQHGTRVAAALASEHLYFSANLGELCDGCMAAVAAHTGRTLAAVAGARVGRSEIAVVAAGAGAALVSPRGGARLPSGSVPVSIVRLHPVPAEALRAVVGRRPAVVLETVGQSTGAGPVERALAVAAGPAAGRLWLAPESSRRGWELEQALAEPLVNGKTRVLGVGAGRAPGRRGDLYPKRMATVTALRRDYPDSAWYSGRVATPQQPRQSGSLTLGLVGARETDSERDSLATTVAKLLVDCGGGAVVSLAPNATSAGVHQLVWGADGAVTPTDRELDVVGLLDAPSATLATVALPHLVVGGEGVLDAVVWCTDQARIRTASEADDADCTFEWWIGALLAAAVAAGRLDPQVFTLRRTQAQRRADRADEPPTRRDQLLEAFRMGFESAERAVHLPQNRALAGDLAPLPSGDGVGLEAAAFWDHVGLLAGEGHAADWLPVPALAFGEVPSEAGVLPRRRLPSPIWAANQCTACGACWPMCPHSAIEAVATSPSTLLEGAFGRAAAGDSALEAMRRFVPKLATAVATRLGTAGGGAVAQTLEAVGDEVLVAAGLKDAALDGGRQGVTRIARECGEIELAAPTTLWHLRERSQRGTGRMLGLAIDPEACRACGLCVAVCEPKALRPGSAEATRGDAQGLALFVRELAAGAPVDGLGGDMGPMGELLLQRRYQLVGGRDRAPAGEGTRLAMRHLLAALAHAFDAPRQQVVEEVRSLETRLTAEIHEALAVALPDRDLDALAAGLDTLGDDRSAELGDIAARVGTAIEAGGVDVARVRRLVEAARALADLRCRLVDSGGGRAPLTLVVAPSPALSWIGDFPANAFRLPVMVTSAPAATARGLVAAELDRVRAEVAVVRRARLELERRGPALEAEPVDGWESLTPVEWGLITPIVVAVDERGADAELHIQALLQQCGPMVVAALVAPSHPDGAAANVRVQSTVVEPGGVVEAAQWLSSRLREAAEPVLWRLAAASRVDGCAADATLAATRAPSMAGFVLGISEARAQSEEPGGRLGERGDGRIAALEAQHREALATLEADVARRLAARARARLQSWLTRKSNEDLPS